MTAGGSSDLSTGSIFAGRYRVERRIAAGGMGAVYEVLHIETNRRRALKVMHAHYVSNDELRGRFRQEARVAAEIESEHIVDVFDAGVDDATGMPFLVMELLRGEDLGKRLKRGGPLSMEDTVRYLHETSLALDKTHRARIVHRDLKPDNLFLCDRESGPPRLKVLDFGIAKIVSDSSTQANATNTLGTPLYMAPEQFVLRMGVSPATDIFALGMIAFTLLVGKPYWFEESKAGGGMMAFALYVAKGPQESAVARSRQLSGLVLPAAFDVWFFRATAYEPARRFPSAGEAVQELASILGVPLEGTMPAHRRSMASMSSMDAPAFTPVQSTIVLAQNQQGYANPTPLGMTPVDGHKDEKQNSRTKVVVFATIGTVAIGLGAMFMFKGFLGGSTAATPAVSLEQVPPRASVSNIMVIEPIASATAIAPSASAAPNPIPSAPIAAPEPPKTRPLATEAPKATANPPKTTAPTLPKTKKPSVWEPD